jgi:4-methylaminobutanoate oxidase (formaldehyde-forming)
MAEIQLPERARAVVIGGGIIGTSVAYHLAHMGCETVLLEKHRLTAGTTWHSAGLMVRFGSFSETSTEFRKYTRDLYMRLEEETGQATGFRDIGFIEVAADQDRLEEYRRVSAFNRHCGVDVHEISPAEVAEMFPIAKTDDLLAGFYVPGDGRVDPVDVTMALGKGAKQQGAKLIEGVTVTGVLKKGNAVAGVKTDHGDIEAELVINCGGAWGRELGLQAGVNVPLQAAEHYYLLTESFDEISRDWPVLEDPACHGYYREEGGGMMIGLFEPVCAPWKVGGMPEEFAFGEIPPDWERMAPYLEKAMSRVPISMNVGIKKLFCGPESFTPDLSPCLGESPELKNYFVAAGLNSIGILTGGGVGRMMAHWMLTGAPDVDVTGVHVDRLFPYQSNPDYRRTRTVESLGLVYQCHYPTRSMTTARGAKRSAIYEQLKQRGAFFRDVSGWEGADWYSPDPIPDGASEPDPGPLTWGRPQWFDQWKAEHEACRNGVILMDMSFMSKQLVQGRDAGKTLNYISGGNVDGDPGFVTYTQWLNEQGTLEADLTVTKLNDEKYFVVASDTAHRHVESWLHRHIPDDAHCFATDVTSGYAQINIQGPKSRELLQGLTTADISDEAFPFRAAREVDVGFARVILLRITYLGELGFELYIPTEHAGDVYERIVEEGEKHGLVHAGLKALASLRMEKGYRDYGHDIDNTDSILNAGLGFALDLEKEGGFIGKDAVLQKKAEYKDAGGMSERLLQILVKDPEPLMFHGEIVYRNGEPKGYIRAASYGHTLGGAVGLAMIKHDEPFKKAWIDEGEWQVDIAGTLYPAIASIRPLYDPKNERIKM